MWESSDPTAMLLPPLPNFLFQRDPSCWIFDGVTLNPMTKPARKPESMIMEAIYRFHPMFTAEEFPIWLGGADEDWGRCHVEGGDVQPIGNGTVMIGMGERTTAAGGADHRPRAVPGRARPPRCWPCTCRSRAATCTSTRSSPCATATSSRCSPTSSTGPGPGRSAPATRPRTSSSRSTTARWSRPWPTALGVGEMRVIATGGDAFEAEREQWDDGNNVVAPRARRRRRLRAQHRHQHGAAQGRHRGHHHRGLRARPGPRRLALHDLPASSATPAF